MTLGQRITLLRKELKITQSDLGKSIDSNGSVIGKYERDEMTPSIEVVINIAKTLNTSVAYLIGEEKTTDQEVNAEMTKRIKQIEKIKNKEHKAFLLFALDSMLRDILTRQSYES